MRESFATSLRQIVVEKMVQPRKASCRKRYRSFSMFRSLGREIKLARHIQQVPNKQRRRSRCEASRSSCTARRKLSYRSLLYTRASHVHRSVCTARRVLYSSSVLADRMPHVMPGMQELEVYAELWRPSFSTGLLKQTYLRRTVCKLSRRVLNEHPRKIVLRQHR